jgi:GR25 family glycosyltransferase involved in LPS biosynthesis
MNIEETFPARYWINLGRREERRFETEWQLERAGITAERFPAVDARFVRKNRGYENAGRYALALSQRLAIRKAMLAGADAVLILEDDVVSVIL